MYEVRLVTFKIVSQCDYYVNDLSKKYISKTFCKKLKFNVSFILFESI